MPQHPNDSLVFVLSSFRDFVIQFFVTFRRIVRSGANLVNVSTRAGRLYFLVQQIHELLEHTKILRAGNDARLPEKMPFPFD
jgi:hypothetical protein